MAKKRKATEEDQSSEATTVTLITKDGSERDITKMFDGEQAPAIPEAPVTKIVKAKIKGDCIHAEWETTANLVTNKLNIESGALIHNDLREAFMELVPHIANICELSEAGVAETILSDERSMGDWSHEEASLLGSITATGIILTGENEQQGVMLMAGKKLATGGYLNLVSPILKFEVESYRYMNQLHSTIYACMEEVRQYLFEGKWAKKQLELPFEGENGGEEGTE
jgi:hypothetical protein